MPLLLLWMHPITRERAKKAFINAVKTHHITGKAAILAEKYASESKPTD